MDGWVGGWNEWVGGMNRWEGWDGMGWMGGLVE